MRALALKLYRVPTESLKHLRLVPHRHKKESAAHAGQLHILWTKSGLDDCPLVLSVAIAAEIVFPAIVYASVAVTDADLPVLLFSVRQFVFLVQQQAIIFVVRSIVVVSAVISQPFAFSAVFDLPVSDIATPT